MTDEIPNCQGLSAGKTEQPPPGPRCDRNFSPCFRNKFCKRFRNKISQNRRRFKFEGHDLDLAYITDRIIAVGYPAKGGEKMFRNTMGHTRDFLWRRHGQGHVKMFNLRSGFIYNPSKFDNNVVYFEMTDHHPPNLELMAPFCREAFEWLEADPRNVIAVHCKAGKGRTGVMICAFLIYINYYNNPRKVLDYYSIIRTNNNKGVTIPSQRRYIYYYDLMRKNQLNYFPLRIELVGMYLERPPQTGGGSKVQLTALVGKTKVFVANKLVLSKATYAAEKQSWTAIDDEKLVFDDRTDGRSHASLRAYSFMVPKDKRVFVEGDVRINLHDVENNKKIGHVWFNTMFACEGMCKTKFVYGDRQWPYPSDGTSIGCYGRMAPNRKEMTQWIVNEGKLEEVILEDESSTTTVRSETSVVPLIVTIEEPRGLDEHAPKETLQQVYDEREIARPRIEISNILHQAHKKGIVKDDYNNGRLPIGRPGYLTYGECGPQQDNVAIQAVLARRDHLLTFPVYEMDKALKDGSLNKGMKLHVMVRCIDGNDKDSVRLAEEFCKDVFEKENASALNAYDKLDKRYLPTQTDTDATVKTGAELKNPPAVMYSDKSRTYHGKPSAALSDKYYKDIPLANQDRWCRYFYKQRDESPSRYPDLHPTCPLTGNKFHFVPDVDQPGASVDLEILNEPSTSQGPADATTTDDSAKKQKKGLVQSVASIFGKKTPKNKEKKPLTKDK